MTKAAITVIRYIALSMIQLWFLRRCVTFADRLAIKKTSWHAFYAVRASTHTVFNCQAAIFRVCTNQIGSALTASLVNVVAKRLTRIYSCSAVSVIDLITPSASSQLSSIYHKPGDASIASIANSVVPESIIMRKMYATVLISQTMTILCLKISHYATSVDKMNTRSKVAASASKKLLPKWIVEEKLWNVVIVAFIVILPVLAFPMKNFICCY